MSLEETTAPLTKAIINNVSIQKHHPELIIGLINKQYIIACSAIGKFYIAKSDTSDSSIDFYVDSLRIYHRYDKYVLFTNTFSFTVEVPLNNVN